MQILAHIVRWLSSGLIALAVSGVAFAGVSIVYERFALQQRLGVDDDICWLALLIGPVLIVVIHRAVHEKVWAAVATLAAGLMLAGFGVFQFMWAREAKASHVPSGPFSGIEHDFGVLLGLFMMLVAAPAVLGGLMALAARHMNSTARRIRGVS